MPTQQTFDGPTLEDVLSRVGAELGPEARIVRADRVRRGGVAGFFARDCFEVTVEAGDDSAPVAPGPRSIAELAEEVSQEERRRSGGGAALPSALPSNFAPSTEGPTFQEVLRGLLADTAPVPRPPAPPAAHLRALGVPQDLLLGGEASSSIAASLLAALERLQPPAPLRAGPGEVVVVVGDPVVAAEAARFAAAELGHVPVEVLAGSPPEAADQRRVWRERLVATVAVVACGYDHASLERVRAQLAAVAPAAVWGAVRADRKVDDVTSWAVALGSVTALAVGCSDETGTPASILGAGIPVAVVDGRRSTPTAWTALLVERLEVG